MNNELKRPEKNRIEKKDLEFWKSGKYIGEDYKYQGEPFTGFLVDDFHDNGNIMAEIEYHEGEQLGWDVTYHENGKIEYESLNLGETSIVFTEYDAQGNKIGGGFIAPKSLYNECARLIGIPEIEEDNE